MKRHIILLGQRLLAFSVDLSLAFSFYCIISFMLSYFYYLPFSWAGLLVWALYSLISLIFFKQTLGMKLFSLSLKTLQEIEPSQLRVFIRETLFSVPCYLIMLYLYIYWGLSFIKSMLASDVIWIKLVCLTLFCFPLIWLFLIFFRKKITKIKVVKEVYNFSLKNRISLIGLYIIILFVGLGSRIVNTNRTNNYALFSKDNLYATPRPTVHSVAKYTEYLAKNKNDINDYIFSLYEKYDHVILCERFHHECTQWDMIYNIVSDSRFSNIGTVFTEIGDNEANDDFESFFSTIYDNDTIVEKKLAELLVNSQDYWTIWNRTNRFDFLKKIYHLRQTTNPKVNVFFANIDWAKHPEISVSSYDSIMASNIIQDVKKRNIKKSLIIMNYHHAFLSDDTEPHCGNYLQNAYPGKTANVWVNNISANYLSDRFVPPVQHGKWDVAFEQMPQSAFAFNFKGSPFGKDRFDLSPFISPLGRKKYEDIFTGMIYYLPIREHIFKIGYPYMLEGENENIFLERVKIMDKENYDLIKKYDAPALKRLGGGTVLNTDETYFQLNLIENKFIFSIFALGVFLLLITLLHTLIVQIKFKK